VGFITKMLRCQDAKMNHIPLILWVKNDGVAVVAVLILKYTNNI